MNVDVYRNLHKGTWSIRDRATGRVIGHSDSVLVENATFIVQPAGRERVLREGRKNVHAFVRGTIADSTKYSWDSDVSIGGLSIETPCNVRVKYNPYQAGHFVRVDTSDKVTSAPVVVLDTLGAWIGRE